MYCIHYSFRAVLWEFDMHPIVSLESSQNSSWDSCRLIWNNIKLTSEWYAFQRMRSIYINLAKFETIFFSVRERPCLLTCVPEVRALQQNLEVLLKSTWNPQSRFVQYCGWIHLWHVCYDVIWEFHVLSTKWWYPNSWMVCNAQSYYLLDSLGIPPF